MSGNSRGQVTITLGRGQVVKRAVSGSDGSLAGSLPAAGTKRSVRDRLGSNVDGARSNGSLHNNSKRQRGYNGMSNMNSNGFTDARIGKGDLRFKLMEKNAVRRAQSDDDQRHGDLREKLSKAVQRPVNGPDPRQRHPEHKETVSMARIPSTRSTDDLPHVDSLRNSYSPWTLDHLRRRSPDRVVVTSRGHSPPRNPKELHRRPLNRAYDDVRSVPYMSKDVLDATRPPSTVPFMSNSPLPPVSAKPVAPPPSHLSQLPPLSSIVQKSYAADEQQTVDGLLHTLGLGKYAIIFKAEEIDMTALKQMGENDLKELGIPMGPRKKIVLALQPRSKRQPATIR